jgi:anhydro-N-acetylmuramic acid kinase
MADLSGVTAAMVLTDGERILEFGETAQQPWSDSESTVIRASLGRWAGEAGVDDAARVVEDAHIALLSRFTGADLVGFHGLTLAHDPRGLGTHQAGDGARIAQALGLPVAWDFRTSDVALGGEGAPIAPFFHFACGRWIGADAPFALISLGAVASLTWIDPRQPAPETPGALMAFDTGPGIGTGPAGGTIADDIVAAFLDHAWFYRMPPKTLTADSFAALESALAALAPADAAATRTACSVAAVLRGMEHCPTPPARLLIAGGGRDNPALLDALSARLAIPVAPVEHYTLNGDMLDAQAIAFLAPRVAHGLATSCPATTGVAAAVGGGLLSTPD